MKIAVFTKNLTNPAYEAARLGADRAAAVFGAQTLHFVPELPDDPDQQNTLIDQALAQSPDAFVLSPVHATRVNAAIARIHAAGIPIVGFVNPISAAPSVSYVGADDVLLARGIARHLFEHLGGRGRVLMIGGPAESVTSIARVKGFVEAAQAFPEIEMTAPVAGGYSRTIAHEQAASWLQENGTPDGCLVANDIMAVGVLDALDAAGSTSAVVGVNAIPDAITAIGQGRMLATADFNAMKMAYLATECAVRHLRGEAVPMEIELPVQIVDRRNYPMWDLPYAQRPITTLEELRR